MVKSDSGIWINGFDYNGISHITPHVPEINDTIRTPCEEQAPFCGLPWILPVHFMFRFVWTLLHLSTLLKVQGLFMQFHLRKGSKTRDNLGLKVNNPSSSEDKVLPRCCIFCHSPARDLWVCCRNCRS